MTAAVYIGNWPAGSPEWVEARRKGLGGSEIAAVLGLSPFESPFSLWHRKSRLLGPTVDNALMEAGRRLEPVICEKFADEHPEFTVAPTGMWRSLCRPWQIASPDRRLTDADQSADGPPVGLLETKFALYDDEWGEPGTDEIPPSYLVQTRWYLDVFGLDVCWVCVFIGSCGEFRTYLVQPSTEDTDLMRGEAQTFLASIAAGQRPPIDGHDATYEAVRRMHPDIDGTQVELGSDLVAAYVRAKRAAAAVHEVEQAATAAVADAMGSAQKATYNGLTIARRQTRGNSDPFVVAARKLTSLGIFPTTDEDTAA